MDSNAQGRRHTVRCWSVVRPHVQLGIRAGPECRHARKLSVRSYSSALWPLRLSQAYHNMAALAEMAVEDFTPTRCVHHRHVKVQAHVQ